MVMNIFEKILDDLSEDNWTTGALYRPESGRRCVGGHVLMALGLPVCTSGGANLVAEENEDAREAVMTLHQIISREYPEVTELWLAGVGTMHSTAYQLTPWGLVIYFNDKVWREKDGRSPYEHVRSVLEKAAAL